jgi:hypothetical protein
MSRPIIQRAKLCKALMTTWKTTGDVANKMPRAQTRLDREFCGSGEVTVRGMSSYATTFRVHPTMLSSILCASCTSIIPVLMIPLSYCTQDRNIAFPSSMHNSYHMALQTKSGPGRPFLGGFVTITFLRGWIVSPAPNPQPGGPGLRIYDPRRQGSPAIPPGTGYPF